MSTPLSSQRLERPADGRKISGVCAAIARHQRLDPTVVRVLAMALVLLGGIGVIAYFAGLMLIPAEGRQEPLIREGVDGPERKHVLVLGALAIISLISLPDGSLGLLGGPGRVTVGVIAIVAVGLVLRRDDRAADAPVAPGAVPAAPAAATGGVDDTLVMPPAGATPAGPAAPPRPGRRRGAAILGAALLAFAVAGGILAAFAGDVRWDVALCASVVALGGLLIISAPLGGARVLIPFGVGLAVLAGGASAANLDLRGGAGDRIARPAALAAGTNDYHLAAGRLVVDLRDVALPAGVTKVNADVGFGQLLVRVPRGVSLQLNGHASAGEVVMLGDESNGFDARQGKVTAAPDSRRVLRVKAHAAFGQVRFLSAGHRLPQQGDHTKTIGLSEAGR